MPPLGVTPTRRGKRPNKKRAPNPDNQARARASSPVLNNGIWRKQHQAVNQTARQLEGVREEGYFALDSAIDRLFKRLSSTQSGFRRKLTSKNQRNVDLVLQRLANSRAANQVTGRAASRFISASAGDVADQQIGRSLGDIDATQREGRRQSEAAAEAVYASSNTSDQVMDLMEGAAGEAEANANALAAEALSRRTSDDLALIAQQHHDIAMTKLQAEIQAKQADQEFQNAKKLAAFNQRLATEGLDPQNKSMVTGAVKNLGQVGALVMAYKDTMSPQQLADFVFAMPEFANLSFAEQTAVQRIIDSLTSNTSAGPDDAAAEVTAIIRSVPGWENLGAGKRDHLKDWIVQTVNGNLKGQLADSAEATAGRTVDEVKTSDATSKSYESYRTQVVKEADDSLNQVPEARDTTIEWFRANATSALTKAMPNLDAARAEAIVDEIIDGEHWTQELSILGRTLPASAQRAIAAVFSRLPKGDKNYGQGVFKFGFWQG